MPIDVRRSQGFALATITGRLTIADLDEILDRVLEIDREAGLLPRLVDTRGATGMSLSFDELSRFTGRLRRRFSGLQVRMAVLVRTDVAFGLARMYTALRHQPGVTIEVFRDEHEAIAWLNDGGTAPAAR